MYVQELFGTLVVKQKFVVPSTSEWPEDTWGMSLGAHLHDIRQGDSYRPRRPELEALVSAVPSPI